jgi:hypothetical protein
VSWPPDAAGWRDILGCLPGIDLLAARAEIEAAAGEYLRGSSARERARWQRVAKLMKKSAAITELRKLARRIDYRSLPDPGSVDALAPPKDWLLHLAYYLTRGQQLAAVYADLCQPRERLYARLFRIWPGKLSVSASGPQVEFLQKVLGKLLPRPITDEALKQAAKRERARRRILTTAKMGGRSSFKADATVIRPLG